jgi:UPF0755 protein
MSIDRSQPPTSANKRPTQPGRAPGSSSPVRLRSPSEALEPRRAPVRPRNLRERKAPRKLGPNLRALNAFLTFLAVLLAVTGIGLYAFERQVDAAGPLKEARSVVVRDREGAQDIAKRLEEDGVVSSAQIFVAHYLARSALSAGDKQKFVLKSGEYQFEPGASIREITDAIGKGRAVTFSITVPEGLTSWQIVERIKADQGLSGDISKVPPEGSLMPDTYRVPKGMSRAALIEMMQGEQKKFLARVWEERLPGVPARTMEEALILASIVEKETGRRDERERVAAVFVNRLKKNMRLQSDPTILYGLAGGQVRWGKPITRTDINSRTPHNTYVIAALPPTPICNPGRAAITATLKPSQTNEIYFVADGQGGHIFSETLKEHNAAVSNWRRTEKDMRAKQALTQAQTQAQAKAQQAQQVQQQAEDQVPAQVLAAEMADEAPQQAAPGQPARRATPPALKKN